MQKILLFALVVFHAVSFAKCEDTVGAKPPQIAYFKAIKFLKGAKHDPLTVIGGAAIDHGGVLKIKIVPSWVNRLTKKAPLPFIAVADPDVTADILKNSEKFERPYKMFLSGVLGEDSFFIKDDSIPEDKEDWLFAHKAMVGGFAPRFVEETYVPVIREELERMEKSWVSRRQTDGTVENVDRELNALSIRIGFRAFMGQDLTDEEALALGPIFDKVLNSQENHTVREAILPLMEQAISSRPSEPSPQLILDRLMKAQKESNLPQSWLHDQMITLLFAAQETTRFAMIMGLVELSKQPVWQQRMNSPEDAAAFVKEVVRYYSPVPVFPRRLKYDGVYGGYQFRKGEAVSIVPHAQHRNPRVFGPDAREFNPERWLKDDAPDKSAMCAFGGGMRMCIGAFMASLELRMVLEHVAERWTIDPILEKLEIGPGGGVLAVKSAVRMRIHSRNADSN